MNPLWLGLIIPGYVAGWYGAARILVRWDALATGKQPRRSLIWSDLGLGAFWPLYGPVLILVFSGLGLWVIVEAVISSLVDHLERTALPRNKRPLPDLRESGETKTIQ